MIAAIRSLMAGVEEEVQLFTAIDLDDVNGHIKRSEILDYLGLKLRVSERTSWKNFIVFYDDEDEEFDSLHATPTVKRKIGATLEGIEFKNYSQIMAQLWAPFTVGGHLLLKTSDHPFGLTSHRRGLCSYRKLCLNYSYVADEEAAEEYNHHGGGRLGKGPPSRVFQTGLPEYSPDIKFYSNQEFPLRDDATHRGMKYYLAVPVFEPGSSHDCIGVLEFLCNPHLFPMQKLTTFVRVISATLKAVELRTSDCYCHLDMENDLANSSTGLKRAYNEILNALNMFCKRHEVPFAQTWTPTSDENFIGKAMSTSQKGSYSSDQKYSVLQEACRSFQLMKGQGVVWRAFSCRSACFCRDITQLSITDYSFSHIARQLGLTSSFAISLQSNRTGEDIYVIELFLPSYKTRDPRSFLNSLLVTMKQHLKSFKIVSGQNLGKELYVEVLRVSNEEDELDDSFVICQTATGASFGLGTLGSEDEDETMHQHLSNQQAVLDFGGSNAESPDISDIQNASDSPTGFRDHEGLSAVKGSRSAAKLEGISRNDLEKYFGMKLIDVARDLNVSLSTMKRKLRKCGIPSWPGKRIKTTSTPINNQSIQDRGKLIEENSHQGLCPSPLAGAETIPCTCHFQQASSGPSSSSSSIKAQYGEDDIIKFGLPFSSRMADLEKEVTSRLKLEIADIKIRYQDEDDEWVLITGDADLRTMESMGKTKIRMSIVKVRG